MNSTPQEASISSIPFFKDLSTAELLTILRIAKSRTFEQDENLFSQGDKSDGLYILLSGKLQIYIFSGFPGGMPKILAELSPGQYVGEMGLLDGQPRSASVKALCPSEVMFIPSDTFAMMLDSQPHIARVVIDSLCDLIVKQRKLEIKQDTLELIQNKKLTPNLENMRILCGILRKHNKSVAISSR